MNKAKAITILRNGKTLERDFPLPKPLIVEEEDDEDVESLKERDEPKDIVVEDEIGVKNPWLRNQQSIPCRLCIPKG